MSDESVAGIRLTEDGQRIVGGSVRADGSVRKTLKVRPGYTPVEDTKRYNVKEVRSEQKVDNDEPTKRRPNRFAALNNVLHSNLQENDRLKKTSPPNNQTTKRATHDDSARATRTPLNSDVTDDLDAKIQDLKLRPESSHTPSTVESTDKPIKEQKPTAVNSNKKYQRPKKKKYTLADLDNA